MNPKSYEPLAHGRIDTFRREAVGGHRLAMADRPKAPRVPLSDRWLALRGFVTRVASVGRGASLDVARPGRDLGSPGRAQLGQDVLDMRARRLGRDAK